MNVLLIVAPKDFRDEELFHTKEELERAGIETGIASIQTGNIQGKLGGVAESDMSLEEIEERDWQAIVLVGGMGALIFKGNEILKQKITEFWQNKKIVAAICIAPTILSDFGLFRGKKMTVTEGSEDELVKNGVEWVDQAVVVDGNLITANGPKAARDFGKKIAEEIIK